MSEKPWFEEWFSSPYYHLLYEQRDGGEAFSFIKELISYLKPTPASIMLDVACGKGRHSKALADLGYDVTGIDLSLESINEANNYTDENLHFYQHDMRLPFRINYFGYAFNFFTSFGYFRTQREHDNSIRTIAQSLKANGIFVLDYLNVHYAEDHLQSKSEKVIEGVKFHLSRWEDEDHFYKQVQVEENGTLLPHLFTEKVAKFTLGDFTDMFAYQSLQVQEIFGDYKFGPYDIRRSPRMILIAKKIRY